MDVPVPAVYRPHRHAVFQSLWHNADVQGRNWLAMIVINARLGCEEARARVKRRRRVRNGVRLMRTFRWSGLRRLNHEQTIKALRSPLNDKVPF